jgi:hypothetical protein
VSFCNSPQWEEFQCNALPFAILHKSVMLPALPAGGLADSLKDTQICPPVDPLAKHAIIFVPPSNAYLIATLVVARSLRLVHTQADLVLIHETTKVFDPVLVKLAQDELHIHFKVIAVELTPALDYASYAESLLKITGPWGATEYTKVILLDMDNIVLRNFDGLFGCPSFSSVDHSKQLGSTSTAWATTAMMVVKPSLDDRDAMLRMRNVAGTISDMDVINHYLGGDLNVKPSSFFELPLQFHLIDRSDLPNRGWFQLKESDIYVLHWSDGKKPFSKHFLPALRGDEPPDRLCAGRRICILWFQHFIALGLQSIIKANSNLI